jgi:acetyl/propionyl-CoA carboxylase alpha subunit
VHEVLVANQGEVAIGIMRAQAELGVASVGFFLTDDEYALHIPSADKSLPWKLPGRKMRTSPSGA